MNTSTPAARRCDATLAAAGSMDDDGDHDDMDMEGSEQDKQEQAEKPRKSPCAFMWEAAFPTHVLLFHELAYLESQGTSCTFSGGVLEVKHPKVAREAFQNWLDASTPPPAGRGGDADADAALLAQVKANGNKIKTQAEFEAYRCPSLPAFLPGSASLFDL